jgi:hypothetical protein
MSLWLSNEQTVGRQFFESMGWAQSGVTRTVSTVNWVSDSGEAEITEQQTELTTSLAN